MQLHPDTTCSLGHSNCVSLPLCPADALIWHVSSGLDILGYNICILGFPYYPVIIMHPKKEKCSTVHSCFPQKPEINVLHRSRQSPRKQEKILLRVDIKLVVYIHTYIYMYLLGKYICFAMPVAAVICAPVHRMELQRCPSQQRMSLAGSTLLTHQKSLPTR